MYLFFKMFDFLSFFQVLIPVFALGRAQELCILLETFWYSCYSVFKTNPQRKIPVSLLCFQYGFVNVNEALSICVQMFF